MDILNSLSVNDEDYVLDYISVAATSVHVKTFSKVF